MIDPLQTETLALPGGPTRVEWRRSARARRVTLRIDPCGGSVIVTLPPRAGRGVGMALLMSHADWVSDRLAALPLAVPFAEGALVPLHGVAHRIRHFPGGRGGAWADRGEILVSGAPEFLARRVGDFLRAEAKRHLSGHVVTKAAIAGLRPLRVTIKDTRSRWGSCAPDGALSFDLAAGDGPCLRAGLRRGA